MSFVCVFTYVLINSYVSFGGFCVRFMSALMIFCEFMRVLCVFYECFYMYFYDFLWDFIWVLCWFYEFFMCFLMISYVSFCGVCVCFMSDFMCFNNFLWVYVCLMSVLMIFSEFMRVLCVFYEFFYLRFNESLCEFLWVLCVFYEYFYIRFNDCLWVFLWVWGCSLFDEYWFWCYIMEKIHLGNVNY